MQIAMDGHQPSTYILSLWLPGHSYEYHTLENERKKIELSVKGGFSETGKTVLDSIFLQRSGIVLRGLAEKITP